MMRSRGHDDDYIWCKYEVIAFKIYNIHRQLMGACQSVLSFQEVIGYCLKSIASTTSPSMSSYFLRWRLVDKWGFPFMICHAYAQSQFLIHYAQAPLTLEWVIRIVITSNEMLYVTKTVIDGRGLQKWYVFHYFRSPNPQVINLMQIWSHMK